MCSIRGGAKGGMIIIIIIVIIICIVIIISISSISIVIIIIIIMILLTLLLLSLVLLILLLLYPMGGPSSEADRRTRPRRRCQGQRGTWRVTTHINIITTTIITIIIICAFACLSRQHAPSPPSRGKNLEIRGFNPSGFLVLDGARSSRLFLPGCVA